MSKTHRRCGVLGVFVLALLLGLLLAAGTASASPMNTAKCVFVDVLVPGVQWEDPTDGTFYAKDWVAYIQVYAATGPDGGRFLGYGVFRLNITYPAYPTTIPHNYPRSEGVVAFVRADPASAWDTGKSFLANLEGHGLLWTGTWDGHENVGWGDCHDIDMALVGWPGSDNGGYTADLVLRNVSIDQPNWHSGNISTPGNIKAVVTAPCHGSSADHLRPAQVRTAGGPLPVSAAGLFCDRSPFGGLRPHAQKGGPTSVPQTPAC